MKEKIRIETEVCDIGKRLDFLLTNTIKDVTKSYIQKLIESECVRVNDKIVTKNGEKIKSDQIIEVEIPDDENIDIKPENIPLNIVYQDENMAVINKNANMVVHPAYGNYSGTVVNAALYHIKNLSSINGVIRPGIVHRLDKNTSGLLIIAKNNKTHVILSGMFYEKKIKKTYIAICKGIFNDKKGKVETLIGRDSKNRQKMAVVSKNGKNAVTNYEVINENGNFSVVRVNIETGRTHQIRVHMNYLKHPIVGDDIYGNKSNIASRQMLHALRLEFIHPISHEKMDIVGKIPEDFKKCLQNLKLNIDKIGVDME